MDYHGLTVSTKASGEERLCFYKLKLNYFHEISRTPVYTPVLILTEHIRPFFKWPQRLLSAGRYLQGSLGKRSHGKVVNE